MSVTGMQKVNKRFFLIDAIRGCAVINMIAFHFLYDVFIVFRQNPQWYWRSEVHIWQQMICWSFIIVSGFSWSLGTRNNPRRGLVLNLLGLAISLVTVLFVPSEAVWFGILNFIGCAIWLLCLLQGALRKLPPLLGLIGCFALFFICRHLPEGSVGLAGVFELNLPAVLYSAKILTPLGFPFPGFVSSDYFPVLPWFFLYLCGFFLYELLAEHSRWQNIISVKIPLLSGIGRKTVWIYLAHQPLIYCCTYLIFARGAG